jgi:hypothetical protein
MGCHNFFTSTYGETAEEAYKDAVDQARYDYGHDPYNGTISTTSGFVLIPIKEDESVEEWEGRIMEDKQVQKWEDCACAAAPDVPIENGRSLWHFAGWASC